jgi:L-fucose isomerase-like protein
MNINALTGMLRNAQPQMPQPQMPQQAPQQKWQDAFKNFKNMKEQQQRSLKLGDAMKGMNNITAGGYSSKENKSDLQGIAGEKQQGIV